MCIRDSRIRMQRLLLDLCARHRPAVLFVTHDVEEALSLADRVVMIAEGRIAYDEDISDVRLSADAFLQARNRILTELGVPAGHAHRSANP